METGKAIGGSLEIPLEPMTRHSGHICILKLPFSLHFAVLCPLLSSKSCDPAR